MPTATCFCCGKHATTVACPGNAALTTHACSDCPTTWWHFCGCCPVKPHCTNPGHVVANTITVTFGPPRKEVPAAWRKATPGLRVLDPWGVRRFRLPAR